jgi:hypothetical protein
MSETADDSRHANGFDGRVDSDDDFVFEPRPWDIARAIELDCESCVELHELADAMLMWADDAGSEQLTTEAVGAIWSAALEQQVRDGFARVAELGDDWREAVGNAEVEFERAPRESEVARAAVQQLAWEIGQEGAPPLFCLCCIDEAIAQAPPAERRGHARQVAVVGVRDANVPSDELQAAFAASTPGRLATDERRRAVRQRLGRLGRYGRESLRSLAFELEQIAAEPLPEDPAQDDVWEVVAHALLAELAQPALN